MNTLGTVVRDIRKASGLSLGEVADKIDGYDSANLSRFERNKQGITTEKLESICKVLNTTMSNVYKLVEGVGKAHQNIAEYKTNEEVMQYDKIKVVHNRVDKLRTKREIDQVDELLSHFVVLPEKYKQQVLAIASTIYDLDSKLKSVARLYGRKPSRSKESGKSKQHKKQQD